MFSPLHALSPLDGRYSEQIHALRDSFSEQALIFFRVLIEIAWLRKLSMSAEITEVRALTAAEEKFLEELLQNFSAEQAARIKTIEETTNHDVKAVEYFLKEEFAKNSLADLREWLHFGATSEDVNNLAYALMLKDGMENTLLPELEKVGVNLREKCSAWQDIAMLARTHGQPASPTTLGKAYLNFSARLTRQLAMLKKQEYLGKWNGATGNYNAHLAAFPEVNWLKISQEFVEALGLTWQPVSDQIEPHDFIAEICHGLSRINTILIHLARDTWGYIAWGYFTQEVRAGEVGSSTMPHKVNPIDFENAEGNLGLANALLTFFAEKLPITRWQRDLTDSTVLRNLGVAFGHILLSLKSLQKGLGKLKVNTGALQRDLTANPEVLAEAVQTVMRRYSLPNPYEALKELTRGKELTREVYENFVKSLAIPEEAKSGLLKLTPESYIGMAGEIVKKFLG